MESEKKEDKWVVKCDRRGRGTGALFNGIREEGEQVGFWMELERSKDRWVVKCDWRGGGTSGFLIGIGEEGRVGCWM